MKDRNDRSLARRSLPLIVLAAALAFALAMGWHRLLTLETLAAHRDVLQALIVDHTAAAVLGYIGLYIAVAALSIPGGAALTIAGGLLFGTVLGASAAVIGATLGATILFLIVKSSIGEALAARAGPWVSRLRDGFRENALSYLLFLRLVPAFPFFVVNIVPALLSVPLATFVIATFVGIIPGTLAFASVGAGLDSIIAAAKAEHAACVTAKGAAACELSIGVGSVLTPKVLGAFALLGVVALIPVLVKKWSHRHAAADR